MISLIIVNYNQEAYLRQAITSVLEQTKRDWELLIWDDGSKDNSVAIARKYQRQDNRIRVVAAPHQGVAQARKQAIAETTGEYLGWLDSDDWLADTALATTSKVLDNNRAIGMVYTDYYDVDRQGKVQGIGKRCHIPYSPHRLLVDFMTFHFRLIRRQVYQQIGGINSDCEYAYDYDLCLRLSEVTQIKRIHKPLYYYRHHGQNISDRQQKEQTKSSQQAVEQALQRRGLADTYMLQVKGDRFNLHRKHHQGDLRRLNLLKKTAILIAAIPLSTAIAIDSASAQQIIPNNDGTMTVVTQDGSSFNIDGGTLSGDSKNLFHSFREFGLDTGQIANFLSNPNIQNILGRINGGNPSLIDGLIQVTGGNSNLFLMNPSGIIFGNNATLNVPGDFTATTATGIGFGDNWFNALGTNDYLNLVGNPDSFNFANAESGVIINAGDLQVAEDSNISLTGGKVINTGTIETEGGNITVAAIPGTNRVRISQEGQLLSLEVPIPQNSDGEALPIRVTDLPNLLRGLPVDIETGLEVAANNDVTVANSNTVIPNEPGTTIVSGTVDASNAQSESVGGEAHILGGKVGLIDADVDASGDAGGGEVLVGGDYKGQGTVPNAEVTLVDSNSTIKADALENGDGGEVIVWSDGNTAFNGNISARGGAVSGDGGFVEVSGKQNLAFNGNADLSADFGLDGTILLDPQNIFIVSIPDFAKPGEPQQLINDDELEDDGQILAGDGEGTIFTDFTITAETLENLTGEVVLQAQENIEIQANVDFVDGGSIQFTADAPTNPDGSGSDGSGSFIIDTNGSINTNNRPITMTAADVDLNGVFDAGTGNITFQPSTTNSNIGLGDQATGAFNLDTTELTENLNSSGTITIGSSEFAGNVNINPLDLSGESYDLVINGTTELNGDVTTPRDQTYNSPVILNQDTILTGQGTISFNSSINSDGTPRNLTINANPISAFSEFGSFPGTINFGDGQGDDRIGGNSPLADLISNAASSTAVPGEDELPGAINININDTNIPEDSSSIITTGNQTYNTTIEIESNTSLRADVDEDGTGIISTQDIIDPSTGSFGFGSIALEAAEITTGNLGEEFGNRPGNIELISGGNIAAGYINSDGDVNISTEGNFLANGEFFDTGLTEGSDVPISIFGNSVTIAHGADDPSDFVVGNATTNGTSGIILTNSANLPQGELTELNTDSSETIFGSFTSTDAEATIQIITTDLPIVPAEDGTGSTVTAQDDNVTFDIAGGLTSNDNQNLFHSFSRFDLPESAQTANFVANATLDNILARVSSGDASEIEGTIQVTGGNPNLFLLNPAGVIFGENAQLNVPAAFTVSTGNGLRFGNNWFSASGNFDETVLNGTPDAIALTMDNPGAIVNNADLENNNDSFNLVGGTIVNSGEITTNGFRAIALNEGASIVELSTITSTEEVTNLPNNFEPDILAVADLIGLIEEDITVSASNADDTAIEIQNPINSNGQDINLIGNSNNASGVLIDSNIDADGGNINIIGTSIADDGVFIRGQVTTSDTGTIDITGTSTDSIGIETLGVDESSNTQITTASGEINLTGISTNSIGVNTQNTNITSTDGAIAITGMSTNSEGMLIDNTTISTSNDLTLTEDEIDLINTTTLTADNVTLQPQTSELNIAIAPEIPSDNTLDITQAELNTIEANSIAIGNATDGSGTITVANSVTVDDPLTLTTSDTIQVNGAISGTNDASVTLNSSTTNLNDNITTEGNVIAINSPLTVTNDVELNTSQNSSQGANITIEGNVNSSNNLNLDAGAGNINLQGNIGSETTPLGNLQATGTIRTSGNDLNISAAGISTEDINTTTQNNSGGNLTLNSTEGAIATGNINSSGTTGGEINLDSATTINTGNINSSGSSGNGGDVTLNSGEEDNIRVGSIRAAENNNNGGDIKVNVDNDNVGLFFADSNFSFDGVATSILTNSSSPEAISIRHGGNGEIPFEIANPDLLQRDNPNGTVGAIIGGGNSQIDDGSLFFTTRRGNIRIISVDSPDNNKLGNFDSKISSPVESVATATNNLPKKLDISSIPEAKKILREIEQQAAQKPALVYINFTSPEIKAGTSNPDQDFAKIESRRIAEYQKALGLTGIQVEPTISFEAQPTDKLEILVITPEGEPIFVDRVTFEKDGKTVDVTRKDVETQAQDLYIQSAGQQQDDWEIPAEQLYEWLIASIEEQLEARKIDNLLFVLPPKLRSLPLAALYDWEQDRVLVEKGYNIGLAPSINLMNTTYNKDVRQASVLALGASKFEASQNQKDLNAVEVELPQIVNLRGGKQPILNEQFTLENLQNNLDRNSLPIIHLSTHANFDTDNIDDIYIQLYNQKLTLNELRSLDLKIGDNDLELLVLSACRSAFGDIDAELGFSGLAVKVGVKTAVGSLWKVSDLTTPSLMIEFYHQLKTSPFKAEALRLAQVAMRNKEIAIDLQNRQMITSWGEVIELPDNVVADSLKSYIGEININKIYREDRQDRQISIRGENIELSENVVAKLLASNTRSIKIDKIDLENRQLITTQGQVIELPDNIIAKLLDKTEKAIDLSNPYYWAPFTIIGSPW